MLANSGKQAAAYSDGIGTAGAAYSEDRHGAFIVSQGRAR
jgi:hypothetical protein